MISLRFSDIRVDSINHLYLQQEVGVDVLRLDRLHAGISGNKWFKLKEYLAEAEQQGKKTILTFGGAFSNHIAATAAACKEAGFRSIGIIRGEQAPVLSHTLEQALVKGMDLYFISRVAYKQKEIPPAVWEKYPAEGVYIINEGGYGVRGRQGAERILDYCPREQYTHIVAACGTGTTLAGLVAAAIPHQQVIGIPVLKNYMDMERDINQLLLPSLHAHYTLIHDYHFGGYAKHLPELIRFMNQWYRQTGIPSDFVYTGKLFYAVDDLIRKGYFPPGSRILVVHSGGLQGNDSLPKGTLIFP
jgi:1-aminocyclopropane-1-carboxylate deaminase